MQSFHGCAHRKVFQIFETRQSASHVNGGGGNGTLLNEHNDSFMVR